MSDTVVLERAMYQELIAAWVYFHVILGWDEAEKRIMQAIAKGDKK